MKIDMKADWNRRAQKDPMYYIASWKKDWSLSDFLQSGEEDCQNFLDPRLKEIGFHTADRTVLEIGCGLGRLSHALARRFAKVQALDISETMIAKGQELNKGIKNIEWVLSNGSDLHPIPAQSVDFVFSYLVLQHLPSEDLVRKYLSEVTRVLRPNGVFLLQFKSGMSGSLGIKGRILWPLVEWLQKSGMRSLAQLSAKLAGLDMELLCKSWKGSVISADLVHQDFLKLGAKDLVITGTGTERTWVLGKR